MASAIIGCTFRIVLKHVTWLSAALGMSTSLAVMQLLKCLHPPGKTENVVSSAKSHA